MIPFQMWMFLIKHPMHLFKLMTITPDKNAPITDQQKQHIERLKDTL